MCFDEEKNRLFGDTFRTLKTAMKIFVKSIFTVSKFLSF
jgi:hypothetical protein